MANLTAARWQALLPSESVSQQEADEKAGDAAAKKALVDASRANLRRLEVLQGFKRIVAPFDGVVTARKTDIGALITAGSQARSCSRSPTCARSASTSACRRRFPPRFVPGSRPRSICRNTQA